MVRDYKSKPGSSYGNFTEADMQEALQAVKDGMPKATAARTFGVDRGTLRYRVKQAIKEVKVSKPGGQTTFSEEEEHELVDYIATMAKWGFPVSSLDLRIFSKSYLGRRRRKIPVEPGKSVSALATSSESSEEENEDREPEDEVENSTDAGVARRSNPNSSNPPAEHLANKKTKQSEQRSAPKPELVEEVSLTDVKLNDFLAVHYESHWWLGRVDKIGDEDVFVKFLAPHGPKTQFHWPSTDDNLWVQEENFICRLKSQPVPRGSRNYVISPDAMDEIEDMFLESLLENNC